MARMIPLLMRSERRVRVIAGMLVLMFLPPFLALTVIAGKFQDVRDPAAADRAQLARNLAEGKGFTTNHIRPLSRSLYKETDLTSHPDLYNAPAYPVLLGGVFWVLDLLGVPPMDGVVAGFGATLWVLSVWLTYLAGRKWFGGGVGMMAALFYGCSTGVLMMSVEGSVAPLLVICVLTAMWAANVSFQTNREVGGGRESATKGTKDGADLGAGRVVLAGLACGAAVLTHYIMAVFAAMFGVYLLAGQKSKARTLGLFLLGLAVVLVPWMIRNFQMVGTAWSGLYGYELMTRTAVYPGDSVYLMASTAQSPLGYAVTHPTAMLVKLLGSMAQYRTLALRVLEPLLVIVFLVALFSRGARREWRRTLIFGVTATAACLVASGLFRVDAAFLVVWLPLAAVACAVFVKNWIEERVGEFSYAGLKRLVTGREVTESEQKRWRFMWRIHLGLKPSRFLVYAAVMFLAFVPVLVALRGRAPAADLIEGKDVAELKRFVKEDQVVLTDQPALVAWHAQRTAVGLFQKEDDLLQFAKDCGEPAAIYITLAAVRTGSEEVGDWWKWVGTPQGIYRSWVPVDPMPSKALLRLHSPQLKAQTELELARWINAVNKDPSAPEPRVQLAQEYFNRDMLQEAFREYSNALQRDSYNLDAILGMEQVIACLNDAVSALSMAQRALQFSGEEPQGRAMLQEARRVFKKAQAILPNNVWLLIQLASCETKLKNWNEAERYLTRAAQASANRVSSELLVGLLHMKRGKLDEAARVFEDLTIRQAANPFGHIALGETRMAQGQYQEAVVSFERAQQLRPNGFRAYAQAAMAYAHLKQFDKAEQNFETAVRLAPTAIEVRYAYGEFLEIQGKLERAKQVFEGLLTVNPDDPYTLIKLANLLAQSRGDLQRALSLAQRAAQIYPTSDVIQGTLGWIYHLSGENDKALGHLREAIRLAPSVAVYHFNLGKILLTMGHKLEGKDALRAASSRQPSPEMKAEIERLLAIP